MSLQQCLLGAPARDDDTFGILEYGQPELLIFLFVAAHYAAPSSAAARAVPTTRARILAKAVSREVEVSSLNGAYPQSSEVPSCSIGMKRAASTTRSRTTSGVSVGGLIGAVTPMNTRC